MFYVYALIVYFALSLVVALIFLNFSHVAYARKQRERSSRRHERALQRIRDAHSVFAS